MPIYEYKCPKCGAEQERLVRSTEAPPPDCPDCSTPEEPVPMTKKVSATSFILKGGGWEKDGYSG